MIYLDYAATTPVDPEVMKEMQPYFTKHFANTSSLHSMGQIVSDKVEKARDNIAQYLKANRKEIIFTSSASESNNTVLKGIAQSYKNKGNHIIISAIEHSCIQKAASWLQTQGFKVDRLSVDKYGLVDLNQLEKLITKKTILISIMHANNEIGTIQPITEIGEICEKNQVLFHTDAAQSFGKIPIDVKKNKIDLLTASGHKLYGPKGVALLYKKQSVRLEPLLHGGGHEFGLRASTLNVPAIIGFNKAVEISMQEMKDEAKRLTKLRDYAIDQILNKIKNSYLNGHSSQRLPNNINVRFDTVEGESMLLRLDMENIAVSTGSACSSSSLQASPTLLALGLQKHQTHGSLRITLGRWTQKKDLDYLVKHLSVIVRDLRQMSPIKIK